MAMEKSGKSGKLQGIDTNKIVDDFWKRKAKILEEKQFNKKVELNNNLNKYMKNNNLRYEVNGSEQKLYKGDKQISYLASDDIKKGIKDKKYLYENQIGQNDKQQSKNNIAN